MWGRENEAWRRYEKDVLAIDNYDAALLSAYMRHVAIHRIDAHVTEVADLQRYKLIRKFGLIKNALRERKGEPFIFFLTLN